ncbi:MAG TPA: OsmC family protein [Rhizomicrobium sp.]|nr:OsmC family protein [Rhizomicrobium sp.]
MTSSKLPDSETVLVTETGQGKFQMEARMGASVLVMDEPVAAGGAGAGPNPYDMIAAAVGACTAMTIRLYANRKGWPLEQVRAAVRHSRPSLDAKDQFTLDITLEGPLDAEQKARMMEIAERCPVHLTLARGSEVVARLAPEEKIAAMRPIQSAGHMSCMEEACAE